LAVDCRVNKRGATAASHVYLTVGHMLNVDRLHSKREDHGAVGKVFDNHVLLALILLRSLGNHTVVLFFNREVVALSYNYFLSFHFHLLHLLGSRFALKFKLWFRQGLVFFFFEK